MRLVLSLALTLAAAGCGPRYARVPVLEEGGIRVELRAETRGGEAVPRDFQHPVTISGVRIAHILARLDVRHGPGSDRERSPAVPTELLYPLGEAISKALARATPEQEIVVRAIRTQRRLGLFSQKHVTGFVAWVQNEQLVLHFSHVDWRVPKGPDEKIPEPFAGKPADRLRLLTGEAMTPLGPSGVAVSWRDPIFREASHVRVAPGGRVLRRTILLEGRSTEPDAADVGAEGAPRALEPELPELPRGLSPALLRELADLEEARRAGDITEGEYDARRRLLLERETSP